MLASTHTHINTPPHSTSYTTHDSKTSMTACTTANRSHLSLPTTIKTRIQISLTTEMYFILASTNGNATTPLKQAFLHRGSHTHATCTLHITPRHYSTFGRARLSDAIFTTSPSPPPLHISKHKALPQPPTLLLLCTRPLMEIDTIPK
jgi:hypothetical protein